MRVGDVQDVLGPALSAALTRKGYETLTPVQEAVLDPALVGRDLRITSQTGSGKTVAIGFVLRRWLEGLEPEHKPRALVVCPTRELALQSQAELQWLFADLGVRVVTTTGGAGYRDELRALRRSPSVIVGTPGRLLDHLGRGAIDTSELRAVVLDEADRMLDLGFREDIEAIFAKVPANRETHLVTATLPRGVRALADRVQRDPAHVEGTRLGAANSDIDHVIHLIEPNATVDAIVNLLLATPDTQTLIFARTRAGVASLADRLADAGFGVATLSGELDQAARNRALAAFKAKQRHVLVATDVAARGIDVQDIARVIHAEPPTNADAYTHRSGRTGRAGKRGVSSLLVTPAGIVQVTRLLRMANVAHRVEPVPSADSIRRGRDQRVLEELIEEAPDAQTEAADRDERLLALAARLLESPQPQRAIARLLARSRVDGPTEPREIRVLAPRAPQPRAPQPRSPQSRSPQGAFSPDRARGVESGFARFHVSVGKRHGATPHRLLALLCKRGGVRGRDIGAIVVQDSFSLVDVESTVAPAFALAAAKPDPRDPHVRIRPDRAPLPRVPRSPAPANPPRGEAPTRLRRSSRRLDATNLSRRREAPA